MALTDEQKKSDLAQVERANLFTAIGAGMSALGSIFEGVSVYKTAAGRASVYSANAASLRAAIPDYQQAADQGVDTVRQDTANLVSAQRAALAANGVVVDQDTALEALIQASSVGARDVVIALQNSRKEIADLQNRANMQDFEAKLAKREGKGGLLSAVGKAGKTVLGAYDTISSRNSKFVTGG